MKQQQLDIKGTCKENSEKKIRDPDGIWTHDPVT